MSSKKKLFLFISLFYILYTVVPIVSDVLKFPESIVNLFTFVVLLLLYPRVFQNNVVKWFFVYAVILFFYLLFDKPLTIGIGTVSDNKKIIIEYAFFLPSISIFSILYYLKDEKLYKAISYMSLVFIAISFFYIIPQILSDSFILRKSHQLLVEQNLKIPGMPHYLLMHAYIFLVPSVLYGIKVNSDWKKAGLFAFFIALIFIIIHTYVTTSIILSFGIILFILIYRPNRGARNFLILFLLILVLLILHFSGVILQAFDFLINLFEGSAVQPKIEGFKYIYMNGDIQSSGGHITGRMNFHDMSWKAFSENFLIGGTSPVGGHSSLIDRLGGMGLIGFLPFIMMIVSQIKIMLRVITNIEQRLYYYLGLGAAFVILYQKGLFGQEGWLFLMVIMPGLIISFKNVQLLKNPNVIGSHNSGDSVLV